MRHQGQGALRQFCRLAPGLDGIILGHWDGKTVLLVAPTRFLPSFFNRCSHAILQAGTRSGKHAATVGSS